MTAIERNRVTIDEFRELALKQGRSSGKRRSKYGAQRSGGYASKKERYRAAQLRQLQRAGIISGLREQVPFELVPVQRGDDGKVIEHACRYIADFVYIDNDTGLTVVEDAKGYRTAEYKIKRKLMLHLFGIRIKET